MANDVTDIMRNLESSSKGLDQNMKAVQGNILLKGYFNRKKRDERKRKKAEAKRVEEAGD